MAVRPYEFQVEGYLAEQGRESFADLDIEEVPAGLVLRGEVVDESHLHGIMARFRVHGLVVVSAQPLRE
ncbi:hypothetical protein SAMN05216207_101019 [Pseudonocardia ammonioxydans]|uniref:Uncharacterized protein n=1 Tax=Pseudonocardia ammonioxydans TaxID=260086 RepID=A0A1I4X4A7_PSUAM|nr:hypothetical protein [Pseudonocardia ammonioxydans]SFN20246.1 hypothetical protein SAMN05216207_101019 [Pseudonocardia ammonioxydans]